ncbi:copper chaperone Copz family protein [Carboxydothermus ferrireducens]|uniref:Bacterioferritin-associated ferredoxin n=1 Tax=Carboxydothermus ferrireducens DSM 11255 TaxID=1119529 RepID=A0ABX2R692_9THEO|nr:copper chaperone Copz family protein [Carboxydothermus ferrireducens]NYE56689.1 bacterioferritin-associated ferredoxin [Carboxydothermus ferrireducens DSM 11255]
MNCPKCGTEGIKVFAETVFNLLKDEEKERFQDGLYFACTNPSCPVAYFGEKTFEVDLIKTTLWYKDEGDAVYLCYCKKVSRGEIKKAFRQVGPDLKAILALTGACGGGKCRTENPLGRCCHSVIEQYVEELKKTLA